MTKLYVLYSKSGRSLARQICYIYQQQKMLYKSHIAIKMFPFFQSIALPISKYSKAPFVSSVFLQYSENTAVFQITMVLIATRCLAAPNNSVFKTAVLSKLWFFLCIKKKLRTSF